MSEGWAQVFPKPVDVNAFEVELFGGPLDGDVRSVADLDAVLTFRAKLIPATEEGGKATYSFVPSSSSWRNEGESKPERFVYRRRPDWPAAQGVATPFDYMRGELV